MPVSSVTVVRTRPVAVCVTVTVTPGSTAPLESVTRPDRSAVDSCAEALAPAKNVAITTKARILSTGTYPSCLYGADYTVRQEGPGPTGFRVRARPGVDDRYRVPVAAPGLVPLSVP